jgi:hypothetical protein
LLRSAYQTPPIWVARIQFVPGGAIGTVCPPICTVAFTENQTVALPVPAGLAAVIRSDEILNLTLEPRKNPATQLRCESAPDVLVVDERLDQADPGTQRRGHSPGLEVICQQREQLLRAARVLSPQRGGVNAGEMETALGREHEEAPRPQVVVADDVRNHVTHPPGRAQRRRLPLLR